MAKLRRDCHLMSRRHANNCCLTRMLLMVQSVQLTRELMRLCNMHSPTDFMNALLLLVGTIHIWDYCAAQFNIHLLQVKKHLTGLFGTGEFVGVHQFAKM